MGLDKVEANLLGLKTLFLLGLSKDWAKGVRRTAGAAIEKYKYKC